MVAEFGGEVEEVHARLMRWEDDGIPEGREGKT